MYHIEEIMYHIKEAAQLSGVSVKTLPCITMTR